MDDLSLIYSIDSAAEVSESFDEFVIGDDIKSHVIPECIHIWRTDYVKNNEVHGAAYFFIKLEAMAGGLNAYYNQTIEDTGRKKIV